MTQTMPLDYDVLLNHLQTLRPGAAPVVVDCTSSDAVSDHYVEWLQAGVHVVTPNKKVNSGPLLRFQAALQAAKQSGAWYLSEVSGHLMIAFLNTYVHQPQCTVGAGLPVLSTLQTLLDTGDRLIKVEGIFSGTLSYIFNTFGPATPFSEVVTQAKEAGYTEPDPRDDLNGMVGCNIQLVGMRVAVVWWARLRWLLRWIALIMPHQVATMDTTSSSLYTIHRQ